MAHAPASRVWRPASSPLPLTTSAGTWKNAVQTSCVRLRWRDPTFRLGDARSHPGLRSPGPLRWTPQPPLLRAVKQLSDLRRDERKAEEVRSSAGSYIPTDPYRGRYVPSPGAATDRPSKPDGRSDRLPGSRESAPQAGLRGGQAPALQTTLTQTTKQTQSRRTPVKSSADCRSTNRQSRGRQPAVQRLRNTARVRTDTTVARRSVVQRCLAPGGPMSHKPRSTKQTQSRRTRMETTPSRPTEALPRQPGMDAQETPTSTEGLHS